MTKQPEIETSFNVVTVQLTMPDEWGDPLAVVEGRKGTFTAVTLADEVWKRLTHYVEAYSASNLPDFGSCSDVTNGFDLNTVRFNVCINGDFELLRTTTEHLKRLMRQAYTDIPYHQRKKAKCKATAAQSR